MAIINSKTVSANLFISRPFTCPDRPHAEVAAAAAEALPLRKVLRSFGYVARSRVGVAFRSRVVDKAKLGISR